MSKPGATVADPTLDPLHGGGPGEAEDAAELAGREHEQPGGPPDDGDKPDGKRGKAKKSDDDEPGADVTELKRQLADERRARQESQEAAQYWSRKARGKRGEDDEDDAEPEDVEEQDPALPELDIVDLLSSKGLKGLDEVLTNLGYTKQSKVNRAIRGEITRTRAEITKESALYGDYPELRKPDSEFFKTTARIYRELIAGDKTLRKSAKTIEVAARLARAEVKPAARGEHEPDPEDTDLGEHRGERESDRVRRVGAQQGDRARGGKARGEEGDDEDLDRTQRRIVAKFMAVGAPIDEEKYKRRARQGVQLAGLPRR